MSENLEIWLHSALQSPEKRCQGASSDGSIPVDDLSPVAILQRLKMGALAFLS
jgi:hypothetical protein